MLFGFAGFLLVGVSLLFAYTAQNNKWTKAVSPSDFSLARAAGTWTYACWDGQEPLRILLLQSPFADPVFGRKVSVTFQSARVEDVLKWLEVEGISFVVNPRAFGEERVVSLSVKEQPLRDVLNAIARVLGAHWEREGNIYILKPGGSVLEIPSGTRTLRELLEELRIPKDLKQYLGVPREEVERILEGLQQRRFFERTQEGVRPFIFKSDGFIRLMDSLTPEQWALHERQGYLKVDDLTPEQRGMLGALPTNATWIISVTVDGRTLTLKNG